LHLGTKSEDQPWQVDFFKFREYLKKKYNVVRVYYFLGFAIDTKSSLYYKIQSAGFILKFREHNLAMLGKKKGNVDGDIIFSNNEKNLQAGGF